MCEIPDTGGRIRSWTPDFAKGRRLPLYAAKSREIADSLSPVCAAVCAVPQDSMRAARPDAPWKEVPVRERPRLDECSRLQLPLDSLTGPSGELLMWARTKLADAQPERPRPGMLRAHSAITAASLPDTSRDIQSAAR